MGKEGQVNTSTSDVIQGGPGIETPTPPNEVSRKKVKLSGSEFEVDDALAAALEAREAEFTKKLSEQSEEVGKARRIIEESYRPIQTETEEEDPDEEVAKLFFEKPAEAIKKIREQTIREVTTQYQKDQGQKEYWGTFVARYPELKSALWVAQQVLSQNFNDWKGLKVEDTYKKLAQATKEQILVLSQELQSDDGENPPKRTRVEGNSDDAPPKKSKEEAKEQLPTPLTTLIARRRDARRKAMLHQK